MLNIIGCRVWSRRLGVFRRLRGVRRQNHLGRSLWRAGPGEACPFPRLSLFSQLPELPGKKEGVSRIWIQAVSVGELLAIEPILTALKENESVEVFLTHDN